MRRTTPRARNCSLARCIGPSTHIRNRSSSNTSRLASTPVSHVRGASSPARLATVSTASHLGGEGATGVSGPRLEVAHLRGTAVVPVCLVLVPGLQGIPPDLAQPLLQGVVVGGPI